MRIQNLVLLIASAGVLSACATGPRPTLVADIPVNDAGIVAVLDAFDLADSAEFTANYRITVNYGNVAVNASVTQKQRERSVTIGDIRYLVETGSTRTCMLSNSTCTQGLDDTKVSDVQITHQFWSRATAQRLRIDASRNIGPTEQYVAVFADADTNCVSVPVVGGTKVYCVTQDGVLAHYAGPDLLIELTEYSNEVDQTLFAIGGT
ncbi:MAG: hypothetical protein O3B40_02550 [Actinobacteria bacterium]|nr:hypothetical protein [Ilumatobacteraceae bacterium]MDA0299299.1 hypothetical protein [Actinomycetota bacterium]MDA2961074.1 hypothetical protein [Actinomycetota bacterium]MDA2994232.1 hypothetical protein [Actinomycetota bacterium]